MLLKLFTEDPLAVQCNLVGNPLHEEQLQIVRMVGDGCAPPVPRPPLRDCDPAWAAREVGVAPEMIELIDRSDATTVPEQEMNFWILR